MGFINDLAQGKSVVEGNRIETKDWEEKWESNGIPKAGSGSVFI